MKINQRWSNYLIELLIVIIGITIAFWLNNLAQENNNKRQKIAYLTGVRDDLKTDSVQLSNNVKNNKKKSEVLIKSLDLIKKSAPIDSVLMNVLQIGNYDFFSPDNFTLKSLIQSGDLKLINSEQTKRELLRLLKLYELVENMQNNFLDALDENYFPMLITKVDMIDFKAIEPSFFYGTEIKNYCGYTLNETNQHIIKYQSAQSQVIKVMKLIEVELTD